MSDLTNSIEPTQFYGRRDVANMPSGVSGDLSVVARPLRRSEASSYLAQRHGIVRAPSTLAKLAVVGGGPKFYSAGRFPLYPLAELDSWAASISGPLRGSTSDTGA
jgi:hypothetical protein